VAPRLRSAPPHPRTPAPLRGRSASLGRVGSDARDDAGDGFAAVHGGRPDGVWSAPGRVNLMGEHTDYNGGLALPMALPLRTYAAVRLRDDGRLRLSSQSEPGGVVETEVRLVGPGAPAGWGAYVAGVFWALRHAGYEAPGADVHIVSEVPVGAGLSSSAALECAVAAALSDLLGLDLLRDDAGRATLAAICQHAENVVARAPTGGMDQAAAMRARAGHALLLDCRSGVVEQVPVDLTAPGVALLVIDTRAEHSLVDGQYAERRHSCEDAASRLGVATLGEVARDGVEEALARLDDDVVRARARHVLTEIERVRQCVRALRTGDPEEVGRLFLASHASLRDDFRVSCPELDLAVDTAVAAGALGARMTGGGFGGSAIALVPEQGVAAVSRTVEEAFAAYRMRPPSCFPVTAGGPAGR